MDINTSAFKEPRGVMRILHFIFSICAFATITSYSGYVSLDNCIKGYKCGIEYPFNLECPDIKLKNNCTDAINGSFSSDAKFFVITGVISMLYAIAISVVYLKFDDMYKNNNRLPLIDFVVTVIFGVLWLSGSAAWANGLSGLKTITENAGSHCKCVSTVTNFTQLNISVIFGFLNFFLWAADLWFLYKETAWFQGNQQTTSGV